MKTVCEKFLCPPQPLEAGWGLGIQRYSKDKNMGNSESVTNTHKRHELRNTSMPIRLPMPDPSELDRRFTKVLVSIFFFNSVMG